MPPWTAVEADVDVVCRLHQRVANVYPVDTLDIVVVGIFHQVLCDEWYAVHVSFSHAIFCTVFSRLQCNIEHADFAVFDFHK